MKYSIDRIEEDICVLENMESGDIIELDISSLPCGVEEGNIVIYQNDEFIISREEEESKRVSLRERMNRLKKMKNSGEVNENC